MHRAAGGEGGKRERVHVSGPVAHDPRPQSRHTPHVDEEPPRAGERGTWQGGGGGGGRGRGRTRWGECNEMEPTVIHVPYFRVIRE